MDIAGGHVVGHVGARGTRRVDYRSAWRQNVGFVRDRGGRLDCNRTEELRSARSRAMRAKHGPSGVHAASQGRVDVLDQRRGQRAHSFDMWPPSFPALQRAHRMDGQTRNRCEFLLREARSLAKPLELGTK